MIIAGYILIGMQCLIYSADLVQYGTLELFEYPFSPAWIGFFIGYDIWLILGIVLLIIGYKREKNKGK